MTEAPERIWIAGVPEECGSYYPSCVEAEGEHGGFGVGYIRADIHDAAVSAARKEGIAAVVLSQIRDLVAWLEADKDNIYHLPVDDVQAIRKWLDKTPALETTP